MTTIEIKAGERKRIIRRFSNSLQATYQFAAEPVGGNPVSGTVEVKGSKWIFPKPAASQPLKPDNSVEKGMWDSFFSVHVIPDSDVKITLQGARYPRLWIYLLIVLAIVAAASGIIIRNLN